MTFGASRRNFSTSRKGGSKAGKVVTGAKCLLFFEYKEVDKIPKSQMDIKFIVNKTLFSERMEVRMIDEHNFEHQVKDSYNGCLYGTKKGYPILGFTPCDWAKSKVAGKHQPELIIARVVKVNKHRQRIDGDKRETTYSFSEPDGDAAIFAIHMKGSYWGEGAKPKDPKGGCLKN
mgnify:CR=1 FL=1